MYFVEKSFDVILYCSYFVVMVVSYFLLHPVDLVVKIFLQFRVAEVARARSRRSPKSLDSDENFKTYAILSVKLGKTKKN